MWRTRQLLFLFFARIIRAVNFYEVKLPDSSGEEVGLQQVAVFVATAAAVHCVKVLQAMKHIILIGFWLNLMCSHLTQSSHALAL